MKHLDLFSGIGGFALATEMVWDDVEHIFCDNEPFSQAVLKKHWPNSLIHDDIKTLTNTRREHGSEGCSEGTQREACERCRAAEEIKRFGRVDIVTGGFPCQPFSQAGARRGTEDDRHLWPEMLRVIREFNPRWVIAENVSGLVTWSEGLVLEQVHAELESAGYKVQAFIIPAVSVNAPHRRDRVWIAAHSTSERSRGKSRTVRGAQRGQNNESIPEREYPDWNKEWVEVATALCRVDDGIPRRLDRTPRLKALGNAVVPQVAAEIMKALALCDTTITSNEN